MTLYDYCNIFRSFGSVKVDVVYLQKVPKSLITCGGKIKVAFFI